MVIDRDRTDGGLSRAPVSRCSLSNRARRRGFRGPEKKPPQPWEAVIGMLWKIAAGAIKPGTPFEQEKSSYQRSCPMTALSQKPPSPMGQLGAWLADA